MNDQQISQFAQTALVRLSRFLTQPMQVLGGSTEQSTLAQPADVNDPMKSNKQDR